ncbi:MAG: hypothetical protein M3680_20565 [Myxococcota bacterium]|nr:hypothetical protein [Myxococcota bacterium]
MALALLLCAAAASVAVAAPKVALTAIDGDLTGDMRDAVAAAIDSDELTVLGEKETNRAVDKLGDVSELTEKQAKKLSMDLEADAVVIATLEKKPKKGKVKVLRFKLFVNGKKSRGFKVQFKNEKSARFKQALRDKLVQKIVDEPDAAAAEAAEPKKKKKTKVAKREAGEGGDEDTGSKADDDEDDLPRKGTKKKTAARDGDEDEPETVIAQRMEPKHAANRAAIRLDSGVSVAGRTLKFTQRAGFTQGPRNFKSSPVPGGRVEVEVYPFAFVNAKSFLAGLGGAAEYDKTLTLNLATDAEGEAGKKIPVDQQHYSFGPRLRIPFGKRATSPSITAGLDIGRRKFKADRSVLTSPANLDLPDTNYRFLAPGLGFRIPFGRTFAFVAYGEAMFVSNAGPIQKADSYGRAKIFGASGEAGLDVVLGDRFALKLVGEVTQIGFTFVGAGGELANNRDMDPTTKDIGGAADRSYGGTVTLGVLY